MAGCRYGKVLLAAEAVTSESRLIFWPCQRIQWKSQVFFRHGRPPRKWSATQMASEAAEDKCQYVQDSCGDIVNLIDCTLLPGLSLSLSLCVRASVRPCVRSSVRPRARARVRACE